MTTATESACVHQKYVLYFPGFSVIMRKQLLSQNYISPALSNQVVGTVCWILASIVLAEARCLISRWNSRKGCIFTMFPSSVCGLFGRFCVKGHVENILRVASYTISAYSYANLLWYYASKPIPYKQRGHALSPLMQGFLMTEIRSSQGTQVTVGNMALRMQE